MKKHKKLEDDSELTRVSKQFYEENMSHCNYDKLEYLKRCYETFRKGGSSGFDFQYHKRNNLETIFKGEILEDYSGVCYDYSMLLCVILRESGISCSFNVGDALEYCLGDAMDTMKRINIDLENYRKTHGQGR